VDHERGGIEATAIVGARGDFVSFEPRLLREAPLGRSARLCDAATPREGRFASRIGFLRRLLSRRDRLTAAATSGAVSLSSGVPRPEPSASKLGNHPGCLRFDADDLNAAFLNGWTATRGSKHFFNGLLIDLDLLQLELRLLTLAVTVVEDLYFVTDLETVESVE
jgi:hypothetical protein